MSRCVLLVAYHFPPLGGSGVQRPAAFARHLPGCGWHVVVLTAAHDRYPVMDETLAAELPESVQVERLAGWEPAAVAGAARRWLPKRAAEFLRPIEDRVYWRLQAWAEHAGLPEPELLWSVAARRRACELARQFDADVVMTTGGPFSVHLVGAEVRRRAGLPWVAEFRDPLVGNFAYEPRSPAEDRFWRRLEARVSREADGVIVTCPEAGQDLAARHASLPPERITTITNGFEPGDFAGPADAPGDGFRLAHVGSFYRQQSIEPMLAALRLWLEREPARRGRTWLSLAGSLSAQQKRHIRETDRAFLDERGYVPHAVAIGVMRSATALYLTVPESEGGRRCIPGKAFEYLAAGRPIFATVPAGTWLDGFLRQAGNVMVTHDRRPDALAAALGEFASRVERGEMPAACDAAHLAGYRREELTRRLADVLARCAAGVWRRGRSGARKTTAS